MGDKIVKSKNLCCQPVVFPSLSLLSPKIKIALQAMENMGFNNANNWLSDLLSKYDGDIGKVLDLINHAKSMRT